MVSSTYYLGLIGAALGDPIANFATYYILVEVLRMYRMHSTNVRQVNRPMYAFCTILLGLAKLLFGVALLRIAGVNPNSYVELHSIHLLGIIAFFLLGMQGVEGNTLGYLYFPMILCMVLVLNVPIGIWFLIKMASGGGAN